MQAPSFIKVDFHRLPPTLGRGVTRAALSGLLRRIRAKRIGHSLLAVRPALIGVIVLIASLGVACGGDTPLGNSPMGDSPTRGGYRRPPPLAVLTAPPLPIQWRLLPLPRCPPTPTLAPTATPAPTLTPTPSPTPTPTPTPTGPQTVDDYIVWKVGDEVSPMVEAEARETVLAVHDYAVGIGMPRIDRPLTILLYHNLDALAAEFEAATGRAWGENAVGPNFSAGKSPGCKRRELGSREHIGRAFTRSIHRTTPSGILQAT